MLPCERRVKKKREIERCENNGKRKEGKKETRTHVFGE
tara:strand:+ start:226 stop:339 length:114 start_codon:yes stop_codon:yes gene_type:complete